MLKLKIFRVVLILKHLKIVMYDVQSFVASHLLFISFNFILYNNTCYIYPAICDTLLIVKDELYNIKDATINSNPHHIYLSQIS